MMEARVSGGNGRNMGGEFPLWLKYGDIEMMYDVMQYGVARMAFGGDKNSKEAVARFSELFDQIKAMSPLPQEARNRGASAFFDAFRAAETCDAFEVFVEKSDEGMAEAVISVVVHRDGNAERFDLTYWLKAPEAFRGRNGTPLDEVFEDNVERLAEMLVETSPMTASRIVEHRIRMLVDEGTQTWRDEFVQEMSSLCADMFGSEVEFRRYDHTTRGPDHPGFTGVDLVVALPTALIHAVDEKVLARIEEMVSAAGPAP